MRVKMSKPPPPAPTASAIGPCPTVIKNVGRPGTGSLPSTIAPPDHPCENLVLHKISHEVSRVFNDEKSTNCRQADQVTKIIGKHSNSLARKGRVQRATAAQEQFHERLPPKGNTGTSHTGLGGNGFYRGQELSPDRDNTLERHQARRVTQPHDQRRSPRGNNPGPR